MSTWKHRTFWAVLAATAVLLEVAANLGAPATPLASQASRPPTERGWPEYLATSGSPAPLVVVIGNSQAVGAEPSSDGQSYVSLLKNAGTHATRPLAVENWSAAGIGTTELELLMAQAVRRGAALTVVVCSYGTIDDKHSVFTTDMGLLLGEPAVWPYLRRTGVWERSNALTLADAVTKRWVGVVRHRGLLQAQMAAVLPRAWNGFVVPNKPQRLLRPRVSSELLQLKLRGLERLSEQAKTVTSASGALLWIWMPLAPDLNSPGHWPVSDDLIRRAQPMLQNAGAQVHDLSRTLPNSAFQDRSHLSTDGHRRMAELLGPRIFDAVH